eukprot:TRINITY_DN43315_c0_g1_i1.p1 TRINITY_DN43315_c0_g1~~TRINITY_DN43315_c0_g1_i1.p1  ORF type:complete len:731 (-),score=122.19 TRINITY_DN43315_c0_g1_i1:517-2709(-)
MPVGHGEASRGWWSSGGWQQNEAASKRGRISRGQKCAQCRQWSSDGSGSGRHFYCTRCWAKYEQQGNSEWCDNDAASASDAEAGFLLPYRKKWRELIELEWQEELRVVNDRLQNWPLERLIRQGFCITGLWAQKRGAFFGKPKITFSKDFIGRHQFSSGDEVVVCRQCPVREKHAWKGEIVEIGAVRVTIVSDDAPVDVRFGTWRLDRGANKTAYERTKAALGHVTGAKFQQKSLRRLILNEDVTELRVLPWSAPVFQESSKLNASQVAAAEGVTKVSLGLIQGPPGTGKTTTTCHIVSGLVERCKPLKEKCGVLVAADSNVAVDQLLEGLLKLGVKALRIGFPSKVTEELREHTLLAKSESHPLAVKAEETREQLTKVKDDLYGGRLKGKGKGLAHRDIQQHVRSLQQLSHQMNDDLINSADVVCSTLIGCGCDALLQMNFHTVVIDEASQATEPRCLVAVQKADSQIIMVGDQQQLPPVVVCEEAEKKGLRESLFDRLLKSPLFQGKIHMLEVQYRMHPLIRQWPGDAFYGGRLLDARECQTERQFTAFNRAVTFIDTTGGVANAFLRSRSQGGTTYDCNLVNEENQNSEGSKYNMLEVEVVRLCVDVLLRDRLRPEDIGVISPYTAQISEIKRGLERAGGLEEGGLYHRLEVKTVDGYQGREKEVIVLSCVRTVGLGFLSDYRRLNVAITRARRGLIIVGCSRLLAQDATWRSYLDFIESEQLGVTA